MRSSLALRHSSKKLSFISSAILSTLLTITPAFYAHAAGTNSTANSLNSSSTANAVNKEVTVYYLNGIFDSNIQAQHSAIALFNRLKDDNYFLNLVKNKQVNLRTLYNPADPALGDLIELSAQVDIQKQALEATNQRIAYENLEQIYDAADLAKVKQAIYNQELYRVQQNYLAKNASSLLISHQAGIRTIEQYQALAEQVKNSLDNGEKVVIVAHSQGNYAAQAIYAQLSADPIYKPLLNTQVMVVGVANVAATTPSGQYITHKDDQAVFTWHKLQGGSPMTANFNAIFANGEPLGGVFESAAQKQNDGQNHGFVETYLSARFDNEQNFVPHNPEIIEASSKDKNEPTTIYGVIVDHVINNLKNMLA